MVSATHNRYGGYCSWEEKTSMKHWNRGYHPFDMLKLEELIRNTTESEYYHVNWKIAESKFEN